MATSLNIKKTLKDNTIFIALIVVMLFFQLLISATGNGSLFSPGNITNIINQNAYVVVLATGMLCCILTGGNIDLSVGSIVCLVGAIAGTLIVNLGWNIYVTILLCLVVGTLIGAWHGMWIAYIHIPPFIVTLAGMLLWRGVALIILNGLTISPMPENYLALFSSYIPFISDEKWDADFDGAKNSIYLVTMVIALLCCAAYIIMEVISRGNKKKKGYEVSGTPGFIAKLAILSLVILFVANLLGQDQGLPIILVIAFKCNVILAMIGTSVLALLLCGKGKTFGDLSRNISKAFADGVIDSAPIMGFFLTVPMFCNAAALCAPYFNVLLAPIVPKNAVVIAIALVTVSSVFFRSSDDPVDVKPIPDDSPININKLVISELMSSNNGVYVNENGVMCDYLELYNGTSKTINLNGYGLSDRKDTIKWTFGDVKIEPGEYLVVSLTGKLEEGLNAAMKLIYEVTKDDIAKIGNIPGWHDLEESQAIRQAEYDQLVEIAKAIDLYEQV